MQLHNSSRITVLRVIPLGTSGNYTLTHDNAIVVSPVPKVNSSHLSARTCGECAHHCPSGRALNTQICHQYIAEN